MKILIWSLLFATAILINFPESNSYVPHRHISPKTTRAVVPFHVLDRYIEVPIEISENNNHFAIGGLNVAGPALHGVPTKDDKGNYNFMTQAVYNSHEQHTVKMVVYIKEDDDQNRTLMGVKFPTLNSRHQVGDPRLLDPHHLKWFITYKGTDYTVDLDPVEKRVSGIRPTWRDNKRPSQEYIEAFGLGWTPIHFAELYFFLFESKYGHVEGAALDPYWQFRPGEQLAHLNPNNHAHTNLQAPITLQPHIIHDPNPHNAQQHANQPPTLDPTQNLHHQYNAGPSQYYPEHIPDQQHHLEQHHNAYQQHNLYQDPYNYPQQTFHPNENAYHQQNVGPSHHYPQQDANPLPNFDPFENWNYPPYHPPTP